MIQRITVRKQIESKQNHRRFSMLSYGFPDFTAESYTAEVVQRSQDSTPPPPRFFRIFGGRGSGIFPRTETYPG